MRFDIPPDYVSVKRDYTPEEFELIMRYGKHYEPALLPDDIPRGRVGWCYDSSMMACMETGDRYRYVEGLAKATPAEDWKLHAWLTDGVHAYDPTWFATDGKARPRIIPGEYVGIEIPTIAVMLFVKTTGYQGVIPNRDKYPHTLESTIAGLDKSN